ncbi:homoisocitrate dehydrogenase [Flagelloscypha sp. PMI_526]|nr:homoisocitrate dehydrogenase [Flagelloscypha sp. PMI_526]
MFRRGLTTTARQTLKIGLIPADGIGREVIPAAKAAIEALGSDIPKPEFVELLAGFEYFTRTGVALPHDTVDALKNDCDAALFGSVSSPSKRVAGYSSPIVALRKELDLYANIRPVIGVASDPAKKPNVDLVVYVKQEEIKSTESGREARATRLITERASSRIGRIAHKIANERSRKHLTIIHKSNVLSVTDGLFRETVRRQSADFPDVVVAEQLVDSAVYRLFREPQIYDVMVAPNLYGDIISDAAAALVGSLGLVPSCQCRRQFFMGEPVHGSAPDIVGQNYREPSSVYSICGTYAEVYGACEGANRLDAAVDQVIREGTVLTPDLGGRNKTNEVLDEVLKKL